MLVYCDCEQYKCTFYSSLKLRSASFLQSNLFVYFISPLCQNKQVTLMYKYSIKWIAVESEWMRAPRARAPERKDFNFLFCLIPNIELASRNQSSFLPRAFPLYFFSSSYSLLNVILMRNARVIFLLQRASTRLPRHCRCWCSSTVTPTSGARRPRWTDRPSLPTPTSQSSHSTTA